ncbi:hypothetical protein [Mucilaginibacter sp.]
MMRRLLFGLVILACCSCKTPTQKWLGNLSAFQRAGDDQLTVEALKTRTKDTTGLTYNVRIYPSKQWLDSKTEQGGVQFNYGMDSCFYLNAGGIDYKPAMVQPIANGLTNCFEYLVSFDLTPAMETKEADLIYQDKYINRKRYTLQLINR